MVSWAALYNDPELTQRRVVQRASLNPTVRAHIHFDEV